MLKFEVGYTTDRSCMLADLIQDYPQIIGFFTDSDCENGTNAFAKVPDEGVKFQYYLCDFHLGQLVKSGLTENIELYPVVYSTNDPNHSRNLPK